jgi:hypothetical protein
MREREIDEALIVRVDAAQRCCLGRCFGQPGPAVESRKHALTSIEVPHKGLAAEHVEQFGLHRRGCQPAKPLRFDRACEADGIRVLEPPGVEDRVGVDHHDHRLCARAAVLRILVHLPIIAGFSAFSAVLFAERPNGQTQILGSLRIVAPSRWSAWHLPKECHS